MTPDQITNLAALVLFALNMSLGAYCNHAIRFSLSGSVIGAAGTLAVGHLTPLDPLHFAGGFMLYLVYVAWRENR